MDKREIIDNIITKYFVELVRLVQRDVNNRSAGTKEEYQEIKNKAVENILSEIGS